MATPMWFWHAPGSGVWINLGDTVHVSSVSHSEGAIKAIRGALIAADRSAAGRSLLQTLLGRSTSQGLPDTIQFPAISWWQHITEIVVISWGREMSFLAEQIDRLRCGPADISPRRCSFDEPALSMHDSSCALPPEADRLALLGCGNGTAYRDFLGRDSQARARAAAFTRAAMLPDESLVLSRRHKVTVEAEQRAHGPRNDCSLGGAVLSAPLFLNDEHGDFRVEDLATRLPPYGFAGVSMQRVSWLQRQVSGPPRRHFRSCAVVGNSGTLLHERLGRNIDAAEAVIRVNNAVRKPELSAHIGSRSTWRVVSSSFAHLAASALPAAAVGHGFSWEDNERFLPICETIGHLGSCFARLFGASNATRVARLVASLAHADGSNQEAKHDDSGSSGSGERHGSNASRVQERLLLSMTLTSNESEDSLGLSRLPWVHPISPRFYHDVWERVANGAAKIPSTGLLAVAVALRACEHVSVYGFGNGQSGSNRTCAYYYDCQHGRAQERAAVRTDDQYFNRYTRENTRHHNFRVQIDVLRCWQRAGRIKLVGRQWSPTR